jgi:arylformamidase
LKKIIDITVPLQSGIPVWPGSPGLEITQIKHLEAGDSSNVSRLGCDVHTGTHIDAPSHFIENGCTVEHLSLDIMVGPCSVAFLPEVMEVTHIDLDCLHLPTNTKRLLLRTRNSEFWKEGITGFRKDYTALTAKAAQWVVEQGINLIGIDYLSVQRYNDNSSTHKILLEAGVVILEGLSLANVEPGLYELICLPLKLIDAEGAPARAVLRRTADVGQRSISGPPNV